MILILGNIYGLNDVRCVCVYTLEGILCVHVDDTNCGGSCYLFSKALTTLTPVPFAEVASGRRLVLRVQLFAQQRHPKNMISQTEFAVKITKVPMSLARKKMREEPADEAEIHAFRGVSESIGWLAGQTRPDVSQLQQTLPQPTVAQVSASGMVVRRVHQHADLGLKIRRLPVQSMMLLLHVDPSLNTGCLVVSQGGYLCGVTDKSLLEGMDAPWFPLAWRTFKMSRTVSSSFGAEAQAMSVACV